MEEEEGDIVFCVYVIFAIIVMVLYEYKWWQRVVECRILRLLTPLKWFGGSPLIILRKSYSGLLLLVT